MYKSDYSKSYSNKNQKKYFIVENKKVYFSGDFDTGNLEKVQQINPYEYRITPGFDNPFQQCTLKTFFHFKVSGFKQCIVRFRVSHLKILDILIKNDQISSYRPVYKVQNNDYERLKQPIKLISNSQQSTQLIFQYDFKEQNCVYFAFSYPYSYKKNVQLLQSVQKQLENDKQIYFNKEVLIQSRQNRAVHLITLTNKQNCLNQRQPSIQGLFPQSYNTIRPFKINNKPKILITSRIHPGQAPSSFIFEGILKFLVNKKDYRSHLLRKYFHFLLIPMLNPDGVVHGMYRLDLDFHNLNRFFGKSNQFQQPTIWGVQTLLQQIKGVDFYFDLHGHASKKDFFVYGNSFQQIFYQIEAETFAKIVQINCPFFQYSESNFTKIQMKSKDPNQELTKQGCGRVYMQRFNKIIHSFTFQCGFHCPSKLGSLIPAKNISKKYQNYQYTQMFQNQKGKYYTPQAYMNLGKNILISVLDVFQKNPYSKIENSQYKSLNNIRKSVSIILHQNLQRLKNNIDINQTRKLKNFNELILEYYSNRFSLDKVQFLNQKSIEKNIKQINYSQKNSVEKHSKNLNENKDIIYNNDKISLSANYVKQKQKITLNPIISPKPTESLQRSQKLCYFKNKHNDQRQKNHEKNLFHENQKKYELIINQSKNFTSINNIKKQSGYKTNRQELQEAIISVKFDKFERLEGSKLGLFPLQRKSKKNLTNKSQLPPIQKNNHHEHQKIYQFEELRRKIDNKLKQYKQEK